jgi:hypothetical protein
VTIVRGGDSGELDLAGRHTFTVLAGRVPAIRASSASAKMAGTRPAMTDKPKPPQPNNTPPTAYSDAYGDTPGRDDEPQPIRPDDTPTAGGWGDRRVKPGDDGLV